MKEHNIKNVLYFAENAISSIQGGGIVVYSVLKGLPAENLLGFYDYPNITPAAEYADRFILLRRWKFAENIRLEEHKICRVLKSLSRMASFVLQISFFLVNKLLLLIFFYPLTWRDTRKVLKYIRERQYKPEIVYFSGLSLKFLKLAVDMSRWFDIPMVILHMDDWVEKERVQMGVLGLIWHRLTVKYLKIAASRSLASTTNSPALAEVITRLTGYEHRPANNCCSDLLKKADNSGLHKKDVPIITYAGAMNWDLQGETLEILSHAVAELNAEGIKVQLHIYTPWEFAPAANSIQIPGAVIYKGQVSIDELTEIYLRSDFLLTTTTFRKRNLVLFRHSLSTKLSEYLCVGKPVISVGRFNWYLHEYVHQNGCGFTITNDEVHIMKTMMTEILMTPVEELERIGKNNRVLWEKAHDVKVMSRNTRNAIGLGPIPD